MTELRILLVGKICGDKIEWRISSLPALEEVAPDGTLQEMIDSGEDTAEYEDDIADREFWSRGQW